MQVLNTLCQADVTAIAEIEVARLWVNLMALHKELRHQEETWSCELADLGVNQEAILANLEKTDFEIKAN